MKLSNKICWKYSI